MNLGLCKICATVSFFIQTPSLDAGVYECIKFKLLVQYNGFGNFSTSCTEYDLNASDYTCLVSNLFDYAPMVIDVSHLIARTELAVERNSQLLAI